MGDFIENLIVEFPGGKVELNWCDYIFGGFVIFGTLYGLYELSKSLDSVSVSKNGVSVKTRSNSANTNTEEEE